MAKNRSKRKHKKESKPLDLYFLLISVLILLPFVYSSKVLDSTLAPRLLGLGVIVLILALINLFKPKTATPDFNFMRLLIFPTFILYFLLSASSMLWAINPSEGLFDVTKTFLSLTLLVFATNIFLNNKGSINLLVKSVIISAVFAVFIGLYQYINNVLGSKGSRLFELLYEVNGLMGHKNQYVVSIYLMLPFTFFGIYKFDKWWRQISIIISVLIIIIIVLLQTRSVWIATLMFLFCFAALWLFFIFKKGIPNNSKVLKKSVIIISVILIGFVGSVVVFKNTDTVKLMKYKALSLFDTGSHDNMGRLNAWHSTTDLITDNFLYGVGAGNWRIEVIPYTNYNLGSNYQNWQRPHNDFLWVLSEKGIFGLVLYILLFVLIFIYGLKVLFRESDKDKLIFIALMMSGIVGYLVIANVTFPIERINHQVYLFIIFASIISYYYKKPDEFKPVKLLIQKPVYLIVFSLIIFSIFYSYKKNSSEINIQQVLRFQKRSNWANMDLYADKAYSIFTTMDPMSNPIFFYKGRANEELNRRNLAVEYYNVAINHSPYLSDSYCNLGNLYYNLLDNNSAYNCYLESLTIYPHDVNTLFNMAILHYNREEYIKAYIALLNCDPKWKTSQYNSMFQILLQKINLKK